MTGGFGFPFGCVAAVAAVIVADLAGATARPWYALVTLGAVVALTAFWTSTGAASGVAVVGWALHDGFVLGRFGELTFSPASATAAVVFAAALLAGTAVSSLRSRVSTSRSRVSSIQAREFAGRVLRTP
jgi:K+-sensing histidine kinase KdpD